MTDRLYNLALKTIRSIINNNWDHIFPSRSVQIRILSQLKDKDSEDLSHRSYLQYRCQIELLPRSKRVLLQGISAVGFLPFVVLATLLRIKPNTGNTRNQEHKRPLAIFFHKKWELIPFSLQGEFEIIRQVPGFSLTIDDIRFVFKKYVRNHPFDFYLYFKVALKVAIARANLQKFPSTKAFIVSNEFSFTSSAITEWAQSMGVEHINIMHGEKLFNIVDGFSSFDRFYFWHQHYKDLFEKKLFLKANRSVIETPSAINLTLPNINPAKNTLTYYLQTAEKSQIQRVANYLSKLRGDYKIRVRPHPLHQNMKAMEQYFSSEEIERNIPLEQSFAETHIVVGIFSTVQFQALRAGKTIVIDDLTEPAFFERLKELNFIMFEQEHILLSKLISKG